MRLMLLVSAMTGGGAERVAATLCNAWARRGDEIILVATYSKRGACEYSIHQRVSLVYLADRVKREGRERLGYFGRLRCLRGLIQERNPEVVISFLTNVNVSAIIATRWLGKPLVISERIDPAADQEATGVWPLLRRVLYPLADAVVVQTTAGIEVMRRCVPRARQIRAVPNPIPADLMHEASRSHGTFTDTAKQGPPRLRLVAMGRLAEQKQFDQLIDVVSSMAKRHPEVELWIWGEGRLRASLERQVAQAGLSSRVFLPGRTASPWQALAAADVFVLTSAYEGFPNVLLEAMAMGIACVTYDCPSGPREISEEGTAAALVPLNDRAALERTLDALLGDASSRRRLGSLAARSVAARYGLATVLDRWDQILAPLQPDRSRAPLRSGVTR